MGAACFPAAELQIINGAEKERAIGKSLLPNGRGGRVGDKECPLQVAPPVEPELRRPHSGHLLNRLPVQVRLLCHGERLLEMKTLHTIQQDTQDNH